MRAATTEIVARAVIRRDGHVLLARALSEPWWFLPGGHVEPGEPIELALIREIAEELGTEARIDGLLAVVENRWSDNEGTHHELNLVFEAAILGAEPESRESHLEFRWLPLDQVSDSEVRPAAITCAFSVPSEEQTAVWRTWDGKSPGPDRSREGA